MLIHITDNQDQMIRNGKGVIFSFAGKRHVLSSSVLNGGFRDDLLAVFNFDEKPENYDEFENGDQVKVTYTGILSEVDPFDGEIISIEKTK